MYKIAKNHPVHQLPAVPLNGTMKTYENTESNFDNPYTAKTVYFFKEDDIYFTGVRVAVSNHRYRNMHMLMDDLNKTMFLPYGVRKITTPQGRSTINSIQELKHLKTYVASSANPPKGVDLQKIQEKYSATQRRVTQQKATSGGQSYWVFFVLNGKGKFHRSLINPMKKPSMDQVLEECSVHLEVAIHRLYTPEGKLILTVDEILAYNGPRIIACPRNERPHLNESSNARIPEVHPSRYAPRMAYTKVESNNSPVGPLGIVTSNSSSGNSIEKRERVYNQRYVPRKRRDQSAATMATTNGKSTVTKNPSTVTRSTYVPKSFAAAAAAATSAATTATTVRPTRRTVIPAAKAETKRSEVHAEQQPTVELSSAASTKKSDDSGTGDSIIQSISSSQQSERPESMTERKAQMIREEFMRANMDPHHHHHSTSDDYSEEDRIIEEDSDFDHVVPGGGPSGIQSGTEEEEEEEGDDSALGTSKQSPLPRGKTVSSRRQTPAVATPSTTESRRSRDQKIIVSRQDTPYQQTPSRPSTSGSSQPKSTYSSRPQTTSKIEEEERDGSSSESESEGEEEEVEDIERDTPAIHTPDTRQPTGKSTRGSTRESMRSFASESSKAWSRISGHSDREQILPSSDDEEQEETPILGRRMEFEDYRNLATADRDRLGEAADTIKKAMRSYAENKKTLRIEEEELRRMEEEQRIAREYEASMMNYTIEVLLGVRFGIDFDTQLYFVIINEDGEESEKIWSEKDDWLLSSIHCYEGNSWLVTNVKVRKMGVLRSIVVGHAMEGYGAGTFIERVVVTEDRLDGRRFLFHVEKWFDSGQVDGLIERKIPVNSFMYLIPFREGEKRRDSRGRWEFRFHTMRNDTGGTTSNVTVIGYGQHNSHANRVQNDSLLRDPHSIPVIQIDFGTYIGRLRKVRFEIDGSGDKPNFFLEYVEAMDLDTKERCVLMVNDWLITVPEKKTQKWQPFREVAIFARDYYPSPIRTYEGIVKFADESLLILEESNKESDEPKMFLQYFIQGKDKEDIARDSSGIFPVVETVTKSGKTTYTYKVDFVTLETLPSIRVIPRVTKFGGDVLEGMSVLRKVYKDAAEKKLLDAPVSIGQELFIEEIHQKAGDHVPYGTVYAQSTIDYEFNNAKGPYFKQMHASAVNAASTARKWKKSEKEHKRVEETAQWQLEMSLIVINYCKPIVPTVTLVAKDKRTYQMDCEMKVPEADQLDVIMVLRYTLTCENFGNPSKVRISCEEVGPDNHTHIHKMILTELHTNTHIFLKVDSDLDEYETLEQECVYPDVGQNEVKLYDLHIRTLDGGGDFRPYINVIGEGGDTGYRAYQGITKFAPKMVFAMEFEAVHLKKLERVEVWAKTGEPKKWKGTIRVVVKDEAIYETGELELSKNGQIAIADLEFIEHIEPVVSGETAI